jgi:quercetin dioxygenase-like cupin family protein
MVAMRVLRLWSEQAQPITNFDSVRARGLRVADGEGEAHVYTVCFEPGGMIGPHEAGFCQLFMPVDGSGWIAGADGKRQSIGPGEGGLIDRGEVHSKGSNEGMTALMIQVWTLDPASPAVDR